MRATAASPHRERGTIAVATAISMVVMVGLLGVVVDLGRMYVIKTELQNAADACALAAAKELGASGNLTRAENAGITVAAKHSANFQSEPVSVAAADIKFSLFLSSLGGDNSNFAPKGTPGVTPNAAYVLCTARRASVPMTLSSVLLPGAHTITAQAVATTRPSQTSCAIPLGICSKGIGPTYGLVPGQWYDGLFDPGAGSTPGNFMWLEFSGEHGVSALLAGPGICNTSPGTPVARADIGGEADQAVKAWNSRFGLYQAGSGLSAAASPPDFTGYAYTSVSWPSQSDALPNFLNPQRTDHSPYQGNDATGLTIDASPATPEEHAAAGASRRLAVAPIVHCSGPSVWIEAYACVLLLHPVNSAGSSVRVEYRGLANDGDTPCSTSGLPGGSFGPLVPVLAQ